MKALYTLFQAAVCPHARQEVAMRTPNRHPSLDLPGALILGVLGLSLALVPGAGVLAAHYDFSTRDATVTALLDAGRRLDTGHASDRAFELIREVQAEAVA